MITSIHRFIENNKEGIASFLSVIAPISPSLGSDLKSIGETIDVPLPMSEGLVQTFFGKRAAESFAKVEAKKQQTVNNAIEQNPSGFNSNDYLKQFVRKDDPSNEQVRIAMGRAKVSSLLLEQELAKLDVARQQRLAEKPLLIDQENSLPLCNYLIELKSRINKKRLPAPLVEAAQQLHDEMKTTMRRHGRSFADFRDKDKAKIEKFMYWMKLSMDQYPYSSDKAGINNYAEIVAELKVSAAQINKFHSAEKLIPGISMIVMGIALLLLAGVCVAVPAGLLFFPSAYVGMGGLTLFGAGVAKVGMLSTAVGSVLVNDSKNNIGQAACHYANAATYNHLKNSKR
jgi:hypothetical protein